MADHRKETFTYNHALAECARMRRIHLEEKVLLLHRLEGIADPAVAQVVEEAFSKPMRKIWADTTPDQPSDVLRDLVRVLWDSNKHLFDFTLNACKDGLQVYVTRCIFHDVAQMLGAAEWGYRLFCTDYQAMMEAFNPNAAFHRTKTLMQGGEYCDFYYFIRGDNDEDEE